MAALDWQTPRDALAALTLAAPADDRNRDNAVTRLNGSGTSYAAARADLGASAVDSAKATGDANFASATTAWEASTGPTHERADAFCRYVLGSGSPIPFAPDASNQGALATRLAEADAALKNTTHPKAALREECDAHQAAVGSAYGARPITPSYGEPYTTRTYLLGGILGTTKSYNLAEFETQVLGPLIAEADLLLAELAFT